MILIWLPKAIKNRDALIDYIATENPVAAIEQDEKIEAQTEQLISYPELGRAGRKKGTRELVISRTSFVVVYRVKLKAKRVEIMRVLHTSQQWPTSDQTTKPKYKLDELLAEMPDGLPMADD